MICLILYEAGKSGTWLAWFINQHKNFPKYDYKLQERKLNKQVDVACNGADWWPENETFDQNRKDAFRLHSNNITSTKDCIKVLPNHELRDSLSQDVDKELLRRYTHKIDKVIIPIITDTMHDEFKQRWCVLLNEKGENVDYDDIDITHWQNYNIRSGNYKNFDFDVYTVDIGKLVSGSEHEYTNLLSFIDEEPIENWKEIVYNYKEFAFGDF